MSSVSSWAVIASLWLQPTLGQLSPERKVLLVASSDAIPIKRQMLLVLRVLAFDDQLPRRGDPKLRIAVLFQPGNASSELQKDQFVQALKSFARHSTVAGREVEPLEVPYTGPGEVRRRMTEVTPGAAYVCSGLEDAIGSISEVTRTLKTLTFSDAEHYLTSGLSVALVRKAARVQIIVNMASATAEGAQLQEELLQVAEVRR